ncbi:MAG: hypothetical protein HZB26_17455 [Candidatus Hydrogenedentes bacterium]|nr:hypothetical protein [Candidatus Hydrogenedentota bacterium]
MPELPEVEMRRRFVETHALSLRIKRVAVPAPSLLDGVSAQTLRRALTGQVFETTHRHGKWLFVRTSAGRWLVLHFGMTGSLGCYPTRDAAPRFVRMRFDFANGLSLAFIDPRKFGKVGLTNDVQSFLQDRRWGLDPTAPGFDRAAFHQILRGRSGLLKAVLMNQRVIAGIGNLYADEMLFQAGLHPAARVEDLKPATVDRLYDAMTEAFAASLAVDTDYERLPERFLLRHRNGAGTCPKCGGTLASLANAGRTAYYCPRHQRKRS